ncbi:hypothetical protein JE955_002005 [Flavobacterium psychrophilum]|nr:hypothetical protein [Flavobacterium psychrophilum]
MAEKYGVTEQYVRVCVKGFSESDKAAEIQADYKVVKEQITNISKQL